MMPAVCRGTAVPCWQPDEGAAREFDDAKAQIRWQSGTRHAASAVVTLADGSWQREITFAPVYNFFMLGLGYGHPRWAHGLNHGGLQGRAREHFAWRGRSAPAASPAYSGAVRRQLPRRQWRDPARAWRARAARARRPQAVGFCVDVGFRSMTAADSGDSLGRRLEQYLSSLWSDDDPRRKSFARFPAAPAARPIASMPRPKPACAA